MKHYKQTRVQTLCLLHPLAYWVILDNILDKVLTITSCRQWGELVVHLKAFVPWAH